MPFRRVMLVVLLAFAWCSGVWHVGLERAGLLFDHAHHAVSHHHGEGEASHDHSPPADGDNHTPVWARDHLKDGRVGPLLPLLFASFVIGGCFRFDLRSLPARELPGPRRRTQEHLPVWQFARRCAPDSAAPPALS